MCGPCTVHDHQGCIERIPSDPRWRCVCAENQHHGRPRE